MYLLYHAHLHIAQGRTTRWTRSLVGLLDAPFLGH